MSVAFFPSLTVSASEIYLISGCSPGLRSEFCLEALRGGHKVDATSRSPNAIHPYVRKIPEDGLLWTKLDVTSQASCAAALEFTNENDGYIDFS
ncbi:hypothetical protein K437DRAFT_253843 [Tilletiaria anomala UBC 951]|uniref:NAD(P)-binding protein n=1 Tax=Tilletiaria anomala (strain ATCC 24038 / CBS 436.72 / UBC 951) TaxID=1037660 RepID=A0A066WPI6_TILAU|nr:uncharacterized protein K437DRAFT_253843 [Tilletiaria anomala UBC 951]KDN52894.1 hypothetical protein K437DRAFT_253843 [Tilletiaria anomala UBC 951]